jgi:hypothetical protein
MKNMAQLASGAAQASLEAVVKLERQNKDSSPTAASAARHAQAADSVWNRAFKMAQQGLDEVRRTDVVVSKISRMIRKGAQAYSSALNRVEVPPPRFPVYQGR